MKKVILYVDEKGQSPVENYIKVLELRNDKDSNINYQKIQYCIKLLRMNGKQIGYPFVKKIRGSIWELRPLDKRILFFETDEAYVLLHIFRKQTNKTPYQEIEKAVREMNDCLERNKE